MLATAEKYAPGLEIGAPLPLENAPPLALQFWPCGGGGDAGGVRWARKRGCAGERTCAGCA